ncbi:MAG: hypothetical protein IT381_02135 [Deltaproteobacteria bacterium]|nr:hypothetical protein [Deltaproteobacteria bacterium]
MSIEEAARLGVLTPQTSVRIETEEPVTPLPLDPPPVDCVADERAITVDIVGGASVVASLTPPLARGMHVPARFLDAAFFALDSLTYFSSLNTERSDLAPTAAVDFEAELFDRADEAIDVLEDDSVPADVRTAAANYLLYTAMFIKLGNDEAHAGRLSLTTLRSRLHFDTDPPTGLSAGRALRREIVARERFALAALQLVASVDGRPLIHGFVETTRARMEIEGTFMLSDTTLDGMLATMGDRGIFNLVSTLAGVEARHLSEAQRAEVFERLRVIIANANKDDAPSRDSHAPWGAEVAQVLIADACMRYTLDEAGERYPLALMFVSLGPAIAMYERVLASTEGEDWPLRAAVLERLRIARELQRRIFGDTDAMSLPDMRTRFDSREVIDMARCSHCHDPR